MIIGIAIGYFLARNRKPDERKKEKQHKVQGLGIDNQDLKNIEVLEIEQEKG